LLFPEVGKTGGKGLFIFINFFWLEPKEAKVQDWIFLLKMSVSFI